MATAYSSGIRALMDYARETVVRSRRTGPTADLLVDAYANSDPSDRWHCRAVLGEWLTGQDLDLRIVATDVVLRADIQDLTHLLP